MFVLGRGQDIRNRANKNRENPIEYRGFVLFLILMEMASSEVEMTSSQTFDFLLRDRSRHEKCIRDNDSNGNNVRSVQTVFEKNLKVFVRDHLNNNNNNSSISPEDYNGKNKESPECSSKSPVSDRMQTRESQILPQISPNCHHSLPSSPLGSGTKQLCNPGQPENPSRNEIMGASSLVQIWEARLQHPSSGQSQAQSDSRTNSGLSQTENCNSCSESHNEESVNESEVIKPVDEGNNKEDVDCGSQSERSCDWDLGEKEKEGVRVLDIIRKLSNEPETTNDISSNGNNDSGVANIKEVQTMEQRSFPQVPCTPRIRGRQAYEDLLMHIVRDRQKELAWLMDRLAVSKFTYRGRLQSVLKIRCLERCIAIQDRHRSKSAASDVNRLPRGSGLMNLRDKFKTDSENSRVAKTNSTVEARSSSGSVSSQVKEGSHHPESSRLKVCLAEGTMPLKAAETSCLPLQETVEKTVLQETTEKSNSREIRGTNCALEVAQKAENSRVANVNCTVETRSSSSLVLSPVSKGGHHLEASRTKAGLAEDVMPHKAAETSHLHLQAAAKKSVLQETMEKSNSRERRDTNCSPEVATKAVLSETAENKTVSKKPAQKTIQQQTTEEKSMPKENAEKTICKETAEENTSMRMAEKVSLWNYEEKTNRRKTMERTGPKKPEAKDKTNRKATHQIIEKKAILQEAERRIVNVETAERSITSRETVENITLRETTDRRSSTEANLCNSVEIERTKKGKGNSAETKPQETGSRNNPQEVAHTTCLRESVREASNGREEEETTKHVSRQRAIEKTCLQDDEEVSTSRSSDDKNGAEEAEDKKKQKQESSEKRENAESTTTTTCLLLESAEFVNNWDERGTAEDEVDDHDNDDDDEEQFADYDPYNVESTYDWFNDISRPRSYWEDLRKQWYLEVLNTDSQKEDIRKLIERRTVSDFLSSDLREKIDRLMISRVQRRSDVESNPREEELTEQYEEEKQEESETEQEQDKTNQEELETDTRYHEAASDNFSQSSAQSTMMSWSFRDQDVGDEHDPVTSPSLPAHSPSDRSQSSSFPANHDTSSEMQMICDLKGQIEQLQGEILELRKSVKSCMDMQLHFQKLVNQDSRPSAEKQGDATSPLKRKCCVCLEMPVDSLLYRCGHMCTCLKCAHELQWNSRKCPVCMAPIVDVVRAFLDS